MKAGKRVTLKVKKLGKRTHMRSKPRKSTRKSTSRKSTSRKSTSRKSTSRKSTSRKSKKSTSRKSKKSTSRKSTSRKSKKQTRGGRPVEEKEQKEDTSDEETETDEEIEEESYVMPPGEGAGDPMDEILNEPQSEMDRDIENYLQAENFLHDLYGVPSSDTATPDQALNSMFPQVPTHTPVIRQPFEDLPMVPGAEMRETDDLPSMPEIRRRLADLRDGPDEPEDAEPEPLPSYEDGPNPMTGEELPSYDAVMNEDDEVMNEDDEVMNEDDDMDN